MKKKYGNTKILFQRGWLRHLHSVSRKYKTYYPIVQKNKSNSKLKIKNPILDFIESISLSHGDNIGLRSFSGHLRVPRKFTFFDQPEIALSFIYRAMRLVRESTCRAVTLDYDESMEYCLGAECLLSIALTEAR